MDDDECPDSTVMDEDDEMEIPFPHRRSFDEPQSNRISSSGMQFPANFNLQPQQLPPLPKLIFRPPTHAGNYPSVSFASQQQSVSRIGSSSTASSSRESLAAPRLSAYPSSSRRESFPGVSTSQSQREIPLPRLEPMTISSRSELTISRVNPTPPRISSARASIAGSSQGEFARVGGVSISRVVDTPPPLPRISAAASSAGSSLKRVGVGIPPLKRIGQGVSSSLQAQGDMGDSSRKFGRRFLKASAKPQLQSVSRMPITSMRASSTEEYHSSGHVPPIQSQESLALESDSAVDFVAHRPKALSFASSSSAGSSPKKSLLSNEPVQFAQAAQKLQLTKRPVSIAEANAERSSSSLSSSILNSDANMGFHFLPPNISSNSSNELLVKPVTLKVPKVKERLQIPQELEIDEDGDDSDNDISKDEVSVSDDDSSRASGSRSMPIDEDSHEPVVVEPDDSSRRSSTRRKRQPPAGPKQPSPPKIRRRRGGANNVVPLDAMAPAVAEVMGTTPTRGRGRPAGSGRGRGRPRGSTNKAKLEREMQQKLAQEMEKKQMEEDSEASETTTPTKADQSESSKDDNESPVADTTSPDNLLKESPSSLPLEGDPEVNAEVSSATPTKKTRGRGSRGSRGTPRTPRGSRGGKTRTPKAEKKSPETKKVKQEKKEKESIKAPPPVQVFEEETRMSADIKPPVTTVAGAPILVDEESRASNVSSASASTASKAKRFTKDPIEERKPVTAETLFEYQWPQNDKNAEFYFLQEQISEYLGVKSFKRKYPDIRRRVVDMEERDFLRDSKVVSETQCDLGLTAVHSCDVLDIMFADFTDKYEEYRKVFQKRKEEEMANLKPQSGGTEETPAVRDRSGEFMRRILKSCAKWNYNNNRDRAQERVCSFDLQTGTLHYPQHQVKVLPAESTKIGRYPVAVLPGQFTDGYKKYTPDELFYLPLNTVRFGPINENWVVDSDSSDESSDSDSDSSSNESSSSSSDDDDGSIGDDDQSYITLTDDAGNVLYKGIQGLTKVSTEAKCKSCDGTCSKNKDGNPEVLLHCSRCDVANHPTCLELTVDMLPFITKYHWECTDCKNCIECNDPADEDKMLFCDCCDRGYHIYCVGLRKVPTGRWHCSVCAVCYSCGVTQPSPDDRMAEWHHEFRKGEKGTKFYLHSFCVACHKLFKKGQYCPSCLKVHTKLVDNKELLECRKCEKWVHRSCVKRPLKSMFGFMCDPCDANFRSRSKLPSHVNL